MQRASTNPRDAGALRDLGSLYLRAGNYPAAARALRSALRLAPRDAAAEVLLARVYAGAGYVDDQIAALKAAIDLNPLDSDSAYTLADVYLDLHWFESARRLLQRAEAVAPKDPRLFIEEAKGAFLHGNDPQMLNWGQQGLAEFPHNAELHAMMSQALQDSGNLPDAEREIREAIADSPPGRPQSLVENDLAHLLLSDRWQQPRYHDAEVIARAALAADPVNWQAHYWLGRALDLQGRADQAIIEYQAAAKHVLLFESLAFRLAQLYQSSTDPSRQAEGKRLQALASKAETNHSAFVNAQATMAAHPESADSHAVLAVWYVNAGQLPMAIVEARRGLEIDPAFPGLKRLLIAALKADGRASEANAGAPFHTALA